ncbi:unnamed protein product (macronuclear) [Paramecium tetraurelia]|uniref:Uncharacterized protein n=1 Tax=Paramecium tetraurelia TaxID=5888 RepID=A0CYJ1_PARTE|nr:uncharacterized protein GSPATT00011458001 [Paramecium tetraurelia]CAK75858.1 unnamed protein product [Paramecium tetraurelia]|eukprot:XP_001443255.1 hypothetical protein (macronuclear) [Paramecium tetraurelia strain d4-2]
MNHSNYSDKHRRSVSPILKTTSEDRKMLHHNKENYIQYLEQQLEKAATMVHKKYEQRMRGIEQLIEDHDEKLKNFIKLIKLLQNFAETQEQENGKITRHINTKMEELYHNELRNVNQQLHETQYRLELLEATQIKDQQPAFEQFEKSINRKIDVMMSEIRQSALKVDYQKLEQRIAKLEQQPDPQIKIQDTERQHHDKIVEQQLSDLKLLMDNLLKDQDVLKSNVQNLHSDFNHQKVLSQVQPQRQSRKSVAQQSEGESIMKPKLSAKDNLKTDKKNNSKKSLSRSPSNKKPIDKKNLKLNQTKTSKRGLHQKS